MEYKSVSILDDFMGSCWDRPAAFSALDGFADANIRGGDTIWNKKSEAELMKAKPTTGWLVVDSTGSNSRYDNLYMTTSSEPHSFNKAEELDPYADYDRAMGILGP